MMAISRRGILGGAVAGIAAAVLGVSKGAWPNTISNRESKMLAISNSRLVPFTGGTFPSRWTKAELDVVLYRSEIMQEYVRQNLFSPYNKT